MTTFTQDRELLEQAADALEGMYERYAESECGRAEDAKASAIAIRSRLAQPDAIGVAGMVSALNALTEIKEMVCGDIHPNWHEPEAVYASRRKIADLCDEAHLKDAIEYVAAPKSGDMAQGEYLTCCETPSFCSSVRRCTANEIAKMNTHPAAGAGAGQIATLEAAYDAVKKLAAHNQAKIDSLMLEYCPDEMTAEQTAEWAKHQKPAEAQPKGDGK